MYLVHVRMGTPAGFVLPEQPHRCFIDRALSSEKVEHASVHSDEPGLVVVGLFLVAESVVAAETTALDVTIRTLAGESAWDGARILSCSVALVADFFNHLINESSGDGGRSMQLPDQASDDS
ncbi:hypothetical protein AB0B12_05035 [Streptomyces sp. NPDC044780]|uniref:Uncharacterized protein n=1 Tax=Streptomyces luomodiensis TaxID=3026192 RepID=A0ABY9V116_9ACTN|nr:MULTISPECIES: hypothetical protein [unclassified Streptomyces]WAP57763.1 hypothetical protein N6H00_23920 [Streptomyces sp. S465]WNE98326.1 hypothetical protein PS467_24840 [Streptomyces sp. SCA4-21]